MENSDWVEQKMESLKPEDNWHPDSARAIAKFDAKKADKRGSMWLRVATVAAVAGICVAVLPQPRAMAARAIEPCVEACENFAANPTDTVHDELHQLMWMVHSMLGIAPPNFEMADANGASFRLSDSMGKVVVLNFWASWCKPCREEMPWFNEFQHTYGNERLQVIGVSLDADGWKSVRPMIASLNIDYRVGIGDNALAAKYGGLQSLPQTLLIDEKGRVLVRHTGVVSKLQYEREIRRALHEKPLPVPQG